MGEVRRVKLKDVPLGARFRYVGCTSVWVLLDLAGNGKIAEWSEFTRPDSWPTRVPYQSLCCILDDDEMKRLGSPGELEVEVDLEDNKRGGLTMGKEPRAFTQAEARDRYLRAIKSTVAYWAHLRGKTDFERCDGVAFSILTLIDGATGLPALDLRLAPHPDDMEYLKRRGENWFQQGMVINDDAELHEEFCRLSGGA